MYKNIYLQEILKYCRRSLRKSIAIGCCWTHPIAAEGRGILTNCHKTRVPIGSSHAQHLPCIRPELRVCSTPQSSTPKWVPWNWEGLNLHQKTEVSIHSQKTQKVCNERFPVEDAAREERNCWLQKDKTKRRNWCLKSAVVHQCSTWASWVLTKSQWHGTFREREVKWFFQDKALGLTVTRAFRHIVWKEPELQRQSQSLAVSV